MRWIEQTFFESTVSDHTLGLVTRLLGLAALLEGFDHWLDLEPLLRVAPEAPLLGGAIPPPPPDWVGALVGLWIGAAILLLLRRATGVAGATVAVLGLWMVTSSGRLYSNHLYLLSLLCLLLSLSAIARRGAVDGWVPGWPTRLMQVQLSLVYGFGALAKLNGSFLSGQLLAETSHLPAALARPAVLVAGAALTVLVEAFLAVGLWSRALRPWAIAAGIALHLAILLGLPRDVDLVVFAVSCLAVYPLFSTTRGFSREAPDPASPQGRARPAT